LIVVDDTRLAGGRLEHMMNRADADGHAQQIAQELHNTAIRATADGARLHDVFTTAEIEKVQAFIMLSYGDDDERQDEDIIANPFISAEFLLEKLD
jgi:hypothetical protein